MPVSSVAALKRVPRAPAGVTMTWEEVDPTTATKWLEGNVHNRNVSDSLVHDYATDMKAGRWRPTHQGIAFDETGKLIDGQHRLFAVIEAEATVLLMVTRGLPMDTQLIVDAGKKRTVLDVVKINGEPMAEATPMHTAVARRMYYGLRANTEAGKQTRLEAVAFLKKHWEAIHFTVREVPNRKRIARVTNSSVLTAPARAYYYEDAATLSRFLQLLCTGIPQKSGDETVLVLRNWLLTRTLAGGGDEVARVIFAKALRTLVAFTKGQTIPNGRLYGVSEDPYPLVNRK